MKKTILIASLIICGISMQSNAQTATKTKKKNTLGPNDFPELINADIPGAPKLGKPQLIMGETGPVKGEGAGWAAPAVYDWDGDGKKDLLIGEFGSGMQILKSIGHFIRVYKNIGNDGAPKFSEDYNYAMGANEPEGELASTGSPLSIGHGAGWHLPLVLPI